MAALGPKAMAGAGCCSAGASFALIGGGSANRFDEQRADAAVGVVTGDSSLAAVHHMADPFDGDRGFSDIRSDNDFSSRVRALWRARIVALISAIPGMNTRISPGSPEWIICSTVSAACSVTGRSSC